jgi:hypothetical protein
VGILDRFSKKDVPKGGLPGRAVLRAKKPDWTSHDYSPDSLLNATSPYRLDLEVTVKGLDSYAVAQVFEVPRKWNQITSGIELPVTVDPENSVHIVIDWDALAAAGGKEIVADHNLQKKRDAVKNAVSQNSMIRQADQAAVEDILGEVQAGRRSVEELHSVVDEYVAGGSLTVDEGEAYKARAAS